MEDIRISAVIFHSIVGRINQNLARTAFWVKAAKKRGADIVCFPELNITGYSNHQEIVTLAQSIPGAVTDKLSSMASDAGIIILAGMAEKDQNGCIYASHLVIMPKGDIGVYRKLYLAPPEQAIFTHGKRPVVFETRGLRFGIQLCYDAHFPEVSTLMADAGAEVIFIPHASPRGAAPDKHKSWMRHLPARAYDNGVFIVATNQVGENADGLTFPGNSVVFSPSGEILDKKLKGKEELLTVDLKAQQIEYVRSHRMRYFFPNRRPELALEQIKTEHLFY